MSDSTVQGSAATTRECPHHMSGCRRPDCLRAEAVMAGEGAGTLEHLLREFADKWEATADEATRDPKSPFDAAIDKGFRAGVRASAVALRTLLNALHDPASPVTIGEPDEYDEDGSCLTR